MALRDLFDNDPRSKEQLREEIRLNQQVLSDLTTQIAALDAQSAASSSETVSLRAQLESEKLRTKALGDELAEVIAIVNPSPEAEVNATPTAPRKRRIASNADLRGKAWQRTIDGLFNISTSEFIPNENLFLKTVGRPGYSLPSPTSSTFFIPQADVNEHVVAYASDADTVTELSPSALAFKAEQLEKSVTYLRRQLEKAKSVIQSFSELNQKTATAGTTDSSQEEHRNKVQELDPVNGSPSRDSVSADETAASFTNFLVQKDQEISRLQAEVSKYKTQISQNDATTSGLRVQLNESTARLNRLLTQEEIDVSRLREENAQLEKDLSSLRAVYIEDTDLATEKLYLATANRSLEARNTSLVADNRVLRQKMEALEREVRRTALMGTKQPKPQDKKNLPQTKLNFATFMQDEILAWMFSETHPRNLKVAKGYLHLMGDGPWENNALGLLMQGQDFSLWQLPDADIAHLIVGRNNWSEDALQSQIEARRGQELRIYSQEMWFAAMATGRDPFDADDPELLQAFAIGHDALEFLIGQEVPWPNVSDHPPGEVIPVTGGELGVWASPMHLMDYRVGKTSPHTEEERRAILHEIFCSKALPFGDDCSDVYRSKWGGSRSAQRLYRMASQIKHLVDGPNGHDYRKPVAREDWISDLDWLKKTYFRKTVHAFKWPSTMVP